MRNVFRFEVGQHVSTAMLYGGKVFYEVIDRTDDTVTVRESHISEDTGERVADGDKTCALVLLDAYDFNNKFEKIGKCEAFEVWKYYDHTGYCFAKTGVC